MGRSGLQIFYLSQAQQPLLRKHIDGLPALYLDCDTDIDLERDAGAREAYAKEISSFSEYVRKLRDSRWALSLCVALTHARVLRTDALSRAWQCQLQARLPCSQPDCTGAALITRRH